MTSWTKGQWGFVKWATKKKCVFHRVEKIVGSESVFLYDVIYERHPQEIKFSFGENQHFIYCFYSVIYINNSLF